MLRSLFQTKYYDVVEQLYMHLAKFITGFQRELNEMSKATLYDYKHTSCQIFELAV